MSSRKSVSAEASSSSIRAAAFANSVLSRRMVGLAPLCATGGGGTRGELCGAALRCATTVFWRLAPSRALALVFFFMGISARTPQKRGLGLPEGGSGFATGIRATYQQGLFLVLTVSTYPENAPRRLAGIHQDRIVQSGSLATPCRTLGRSYTCGPMFLDSRKELTA